MSTQVQEQPVKKRKRGRETATDMVRSLGLVILVVVPVWFLAQAPDSDEVPLREIDPSSAISAFAADLPTVPVPRDLPEGWRATSATYDGAQSTLRVGWVSPQGEYAEYAASQAPQDEFLELVAGEQLEQLPPVTVDGVAWQQLREEDGSRSLTRTYAGTTVVVGSRRATAGPEELAVLLGALTTG